MKNATGPLAIVAVALAVVVWASLSPEAPSAPAPSPSQVAAERPSEGDAEPATKRDGRPDGDRADRDVAEGDQPKQAPVGKGEGKGRQHAAQQEHAKINSGYGTSVQTAASDDDGERGGKVSYQDGAPTGELTWEEDVESASRCTLTIRVIDPDGQAVAGAAVSLRREEKWTTQLHLVGRTDGGGRLVARELPISYYRASIEEDDALPFTRSWRCDGDNDEEVVLEKREGDTRIFGHVLEEGTGQPLADTSVTVQEITRDKANKDFHVYTFVTVNDDGAFDFVVRGDKAWQYRLYAQATGYEFTNADVFVTKGEHRRVTFHLKPFGRVEGRVVRADGSPAAGAKVQQQGPGSLVGVDTDDDGRFSMAARHSKQLTLVAHVDNEVGRLPIAPLNEGETRSGRVITLAGGRRLTGVVTHDGEPMPLAELLASEQGASGWLGSGQADAKGRFIIEGAPATALRIFATGSQHRVQIDGCAVGDDACPTTDIELEVPFIPAD